MGNESSNRRRFIRKLVSLAALGGITGLLLGHETQKVSAAGAANQIAFYTAPDTLAGSDNLRWYDTDRNFIAGYGGNTVTSGVTGATISGGGAWGGYINKVTDHYGTVGGGLNNQAGDDAGTTSDRYYATVAGGTGNKASGWAATVGGGTSNTASGTNATVGGGYTNTASGERATVAGGYINTASGYSASVGGGAINTASGYWATVPGGAENIAAGDYSFAAGRRTKINALHDGSFLFSDSSNFDFNSSAANEFALRATGGARFVTAIDGSGNPTMSFVMTPSGNLGVGLSAPARQVHLQGNNAVFRMDRDANSSAFILVRTAAGEFNTIWKTFYVGVDASGVNNGSFFIGDVGTAVSGPSTKRLYIDNAGNMGIGTEAPSEKLHVVGKVRATQGFVTGDITFANSFKVTENDEAGLAFLNDGGEKIAVLDRQGNIHIKGKVIQDL